MSTAIKLAALLAVALAAALAGCDSQGSSTPAAFAPPPPPPDEAPPAMRTYDYSHKVVASAKRTGAQRYTVAVLRFGDTRDVPAQPFGKGKDPTIDPAKPKAGDDGKVNVKVTVDGAKPPETPTQARPWLNSRARTILKHALLETDAFTVVERARVLEILREINFGKTRYVDPDSAPDEGKMLGVRYIIEGSLGQNEDRTLKNMLDDQTTYKDLDSYQPTILQNIFSPAKVNRAKRLQALQQLRRRRLQDRARRVFNVACYLSVYDVHTGQVVVTVMGLGANGMEAINDAVEELVEEMAEKVGNGVLVAAATADKVYLDVGTRAGIKKGARFEVVSRGKPVRDRHGQVIGYEETEAGEIEVVEVREFLSVAKVVRKVGKISRGDHAKPAKH